MNLSVTRSDIMINDPLRVMFLQEGNFQFIHNKCHLYGWADTYRLSVDGEPAGYAAVWGFNDRKDRDTIFEFFIVPQQRHLAKELYRLLIDVSGATLLECQTNDKLLYSMVLEFGRNISEQSVLFEDGHTTNFEINEAVLNLKTPEKGGRDDQHQYTLEVNNETVATGGMLLNYNFPYADIYYEVKEEYRRRGFGAFLIQELKKEAYRIGRVPAARCNVNNLPSKASLLKGGFRICGYLLLADYKKS